MDTMTTETQPAAFERVERFVDGFRDEEVTDDYETRRSHPRFNMTESVDVMIDSYQTPAEMVMASGRDISAGGLGIYSHAPINVGTEMIVSIENGQEKLIARAVAVHSTQSVGMYKIGTRFII